MKKEFLSARNLLFLGIVSCITISAGLIRVLPLHDAVITDDSIRFQGVDAHYHARLTAYVTRHYPHRLEHDDLRLHPSGQHVDVYPAFDFLNATAALIVGLGNPSDRTIEVVAAWTPPILGTLTTGVMGAAGWLLGGPWGAVAAAMIAGFLPGGTLSQTVIGFTDHHALESFLLSVCWLMMLLLTKRDAKERVRQGAMIVLGIAIGGYVLTWEGSPILPATYALVIALRTAYSSDRTTLQELIRETTVVAISALAILAVWSYFSRMVWVSAGLLILTTAIPLMRSLVDVILPHTRSALARLVWFLTLAAIAAGTYAVLPESMQRALETNIGRLIPSGVALTVSEMSPVISDLAKVQTFFGVPLIWAAFGFLIACLFTFRNERLEHGIPLVLGAVFVTVGLLQTRFSASASLAIALLNAAVLAWGLRSLGEKYAHRSMLRRLATTALLVVWLVTAGAWSVVHAFDEARVDRGPDTAWIESMAWLRANAPSPLNPSPNGSDPSVGPAASSHGVLNWWDSGYYIVRMAGQRPVSNPTQSGATWAARLFLDTNIIDWANELREHNIRYVAVNAHLAYYPVAVNRTDSRFPSLLVWAGRDQSEFMRTVFFRNPDGTLEARFIYTPAYFKSALIRMLLFGGESFEPASGTPWVIKLARTIALDGSAIDIIESGQAFRTSADAIRFLDARQDSSWLLASFSPFASCVSLEPMKDVAEVHSSRAIAAMPSDTQIPIPFVRLFEVKPAP